MVSVQCSFRDTADVSVLRKLRDRERAVSWSVGRLVSSAALAFRRRFEIRLARRWRHSLCYVIGGCMACSRIGHRSFRLASAVGAAMRHYYERLAKNDCSAGEYMHCWLGRRSRRLLTAVCRTAGFPSKLQGRRWLADVCRGRKLCWSWRELSLYMRWPLTPDTPAAVFALNAKNKRCLRDCAGPAATDQERYLEIKTATHCVTDVIAGRNGTCINGYERTSWFFTLCWWLGGMGQ